MRCCALAKFADQKIYTSARLVNELDTIGTLSSAIAGLVGIVSVTSTLLVFDRGKHQDKDWATSDWCQQWKMLIGGFCSESPKGVHFGSHRAVVSVEFYHW